MRIATKSFAILFVSLVLVFVGNLAQAASANDRYIRVASVEGDVTLHSADGQRPGDVTVNTPVTDGDEIVTGDGRAELSFSNGIMVRVADDSTVHIDSAYSPMRIELVQGTLFVDSHLVDSFRDELEVLAGDSQVYLIDEGNLRVDLGTEGSVRVSSIQGEAEVRANGRRVLLEDGERTYIDPGQDPEQPVALNGQYDDLDDWNQSRMDRYASNDYGRDDDSLDENLRYDAQDLDNYGDWRQYDNYGRVWVPRVGQDWRPYYDGRWLYTNDDWFWVSYEPWGWAPYHYGRWGWGYDIGWYWIPGAAFAPAWVSWYDYGDYIGWCPLNFYNRPIWFNFYYNNYYRLPRVQKQKTLDAGNSWTFVKKNDLGAGNIKRIVAPPTEVRKIRFDEHKLTRIPERKLVSYVIPKTQVGPGYVNDKRVLKSPNDIRNPLGVDHRNDLSRGGRADLDRDRRDSDRKRIATPDNNNNRDREFQHGTVRTVPENSRHQDNGARSIRNNNDDRRMKERSPYGGDRDTQFLRDNDYRHSRSFISPYYRERDRYESQRDRSNDRDRQELSIPYYRNFGTNRDNGDDRDISPRYGDEARRMFERFDADRQNRDSRSNSNSGREIRQSDHYQRPPDPPKQNYRPSTPPPQPRENRGGNNNHGGGQRPPDKHH